MRGRKPKPTALKLLAGETRPSRTNKDEPKPRDIVPDAPDWLDAAGRRRWAYWVPVLKHMRVLTEADAALLGMICDLEARRDHARAQLAETGGEVVLSGTGTPVQNPWLSIVNQCTDKLAKLYPEFGLTPAARTRIHVTTPKANHEEPAGKRRFFA